MLRSTALTFLFGGGGGGQAPTLERSMNPSLLSEGPVALGEKKLVSSAEFQDKKFVQ